MIDNELMHNIVTQESRDYFSNLIANHKNLDAVICTEYPLVVDHDNIINCRSCLFAGDNCRELCIRLLMCVAITTDLARKLITEQFPEYAGLPIVDVEKQGHDNRTYRLGVRHAYSYANNIRTVPDSRTALMLNPRNELLMRL